LHKSLIQTLPSHKTGDPQMLIEVYNHAISQREAILQHVDASKLSESLHKAKDLWVDYQPLSTESDISGIDSSWNLIPYQGFFLYAVDAVSISEDESFPVSPRFDVNIGTLEVEEGEEIVYNPRLRLQSMGMEYEYDLATESLNRKDYVLIDGSVLARFYDRRLKKPIKFFEYASMLMNKQNVIFVAKTSESNIMLGGTVGDMFYFSKATSTPGFSKPHYEPIGVSVFYARLAEFAPCLKIEVPGKIGEAEAKGVLDILNSKSFNGYPYVLRLAHERCRITNEDMLRLADVLGLNIEPGGREVLGETP
jgi:DNA double-strand break repair nuclease NurA